MRRPVIYSVALQDADRSSFPRYARLCYRPGHRNYPSWKTHQKGGEDISGWISEVSHPAAPREAASRGQGGSALQSRAGYEQLGSETL